MRFLETYDKARTLRGRYTTGLMKDAAIAEEYFRVQTSFYNSARQLLQRSGVHDSDQQYKTIDYILSPETDGYYARNIERGVYVGDSGAPMLYDFLYVRRLNNDTRQPWCRFQFTPELKMRLQNIVDRRGDLVEEAEQRSQLFNQVLTPLPDRTLLLPDIDA